MSGRNGRRAARWLLLVGLTVVGIVGMHGLVGHLPEPVGMSTSAHAAADQHGVPGMPGMPGTQGAPGQHAALANDAMATASSVCTDGCAGHAGMDMGMGSMCLAFVSLLLLLLWPRRGVLATVATTDLLRPRPPAALGHRRAPPDLHRLSILRC